jgi:HAD superfamily hydrolase (TIGR01509 family)
VIAPAAVIFDFNGTISDDERLLARLFVQIFSEIGIAVTEQLYFEEYAGYSDPEICADVVRRHGRDGETGLVNQLLLRRTDLYLQAVAEESPVKPAAADYVRRAAERVPVAIASGAARAEVEAVLDSAGLRRLFPVLVCSEDVTHGKPHPEGYQRALAALDELHRTTFAPASVLVFEDSAVGLQAALAAGLRCIVIEGTIDPERAAGAECIVPALDWSIPVLGAWEAER